MLKKKKKAATGAQWAQEQNACWWMNDINACGFKIETARQHGSLENNFPGKYFVHNLYTICTFVLPGIHTNKHSLWSYILFGESALTAACKNRLTGVRIFKQLLYQKTLTAAALFTYSSSSSHHEASCWNWARVTHSNAWTGHELGDCYINSKCFSDSVHVFRGCGDSYLVDMETKIAAKWKGTFSLPLRLCTMPKKMERERQNERSDRTRDDRRRELRKLKVCVV